MFYLQRCCKREESPRSSYIDYSMLRGLTRPKKPSQVRYRNLVATLQIHLCLKPLVIAKRFRFNKKEQAGGETILDYVAALR